MRRLFSTRYGFFALAAIVSWALLAVVDTEHQWVALGLGCLYAVLSIFFFLEELSTRHPPDRVISSHPVDRPVVLFVCVQNAGRSQMAESLFNARSGGLAVARSAGSRPATAVHPEVAEAMKEVDIDLSAASTKPITEDVTEGVGMVVTMGCGDECPVIPGARVVDWDISDPSGKSVAQVRAIRDEIATRVDALIAELSRGRAALTRGPAAPSD